MKKIILVLALLIVPCHAAMMECTYQMKADNVYYVEIKDEKLIVEVNDCMDFTRGEKYNGYINRYFHKETNAYRYNLVKQDRTCSIAEIQPAE